ncbi:hypothetical protein M6B38_234385 [Iris pallida]|uniref:Uncharacterized protein n=1 Tax=Iris pallida TaxID=29817 RepID=A0AAX6DQW9_IRIPA|nr:hypothetical protein M6B38_234385 [Iris pallida]
MRRKALHPFIGNNGHLLSSTQVQYAIGSTIKIGGSQFGDTRIWYELCLFLSISCKLLFQEKKINVLLVVSI